MMKRLIFTFLFATHLCVGAQTLIVSHTDGSETRISLSSQPVVRYEDAVMTVAGENLNIRIPLGDVKGYTFDTGSGLQGITMDADGSADYMIDMNGRIVPLSWDRPGVYVVRINGKYVKCLKK